MVLHTLSWEKLFGERPEAPRTYVIGVLGMGTPFTVVVALWGGWWYWFLVAAIAAGAGLPVMYGYKVRKQGPIAIRGQYEGYEAIIRTLRAEVAEREAKLMALERGECRNNNCQTA